MTDVESCCCFLFRRAKTKELEENVARLKVQLTEQEQRTREVTQEFAKFKDEQNTKPEVRLQSEINLLTLEKVREISRRFPLNFVTSS